MRDIRFEDMHLFARVADLGSLSAVARERDAPVSQVSRTLARIEQRGSGIILMHDIHPRTAQMLPRLLADLQSRGYKVVRLVPGHSGGDMLVASLSHRTVTSTRQTALFEGR